MTKMACQVTCTHGTGHTGPGRSGWAQVLWGTPRGGLEGLLHCMRPPQGQPEACVQASRDRTPLCSCPEQACAHMRTRTGEHGRLPRAAKGEGGCRTSGASSSKRSQACCCCKAPTHLGTVEAHNAALGRGRDLRGACGAAAAAAAATVLCRASVHASGALQTRPPPPPPSACPAPAQHPPEAPHPRR